MTAPHDKLDGIKPGDRVRVTFEWVVRWGDESSICVGRYDVSSGGPVFVKGEVSSDAFQIERIDPPIIVGDFVFDPAAGSRATVVGEIIRNGSRFLWLDGGASGFRTRHEGALTKVSDSERPF